MNGSPHYYKLGAFAVLVVVAVIGIVVGLGVVNLEKTLRYHTYFEESVQGLEPGAPVKFRGVTIGHVAKISIASDNQHIDVVTELERDAAKQVASLPPGLRAQLASQGITGVKFLSVDLYDPKTHPPPVLPFKAPERYIPSTQSTMKSLEDVLVRATDRMPEIIDGMLEIIGRVDRTLATLERAGVSDEVLVTLRNVNEVLRATRAMVAGFDRAELGQRASGTLERLDGAASKLSAILDRVDGEGGLLASATKATKSFGAIGQSGRQTQRELDSTLRDMSDAAEAIRSLARAVEHDPDMLLKGKSAGKTFK